MNIAHTMKIVKILCVKQTILLQSKRKENKYGFVSDSAFIMRKRGKRKKQLFCITKQIIQSFTAELVRFREGADAERGAASSWSQRTCVAGP